MTRLLLTVTLMTGLPLAGCAPAPRIAIAQPVLASEWSQPAGAPAAAEGPDQGMIASDLAALLASPALSGLTAQALAGNPDIRIAAARVDRAAALLGRARLAALPQVSATAGTNGRALNNAVLDFPSAFASLDASVDVDLFGRFAGNRAAARGQLLAAQNEQAAVALSIETSLAQAFVLRATLARRIAILDGTIARAARMEHVVRLRFDAGAATRVDVGQQTVRVLELRRKRSELAEALDQTRTAMAVLCGAEAPRFAAEPADIAAIALPDLRPADPPRLLAARPDIRAREAAIMAANGDVRAARAAFMPLFSFSLEGLAESASGGLLGTSVRAGAAVLVPIFAQGRLTSALRVAEADQVAAVEEYRLTVLSALAEVENLLSAVAAARERAALLGAILAEARLTADLASAQYIEGEEDLRIVLDAEQVLGDAEDAQALARQEQLFAQIAMYRAMGGYRGGGSPAQSRPEIPFRPSGA
jgi:NodT family efflux transporter outer membrane factor (OMF) lipoprotein